MAAKWALEKARKFAAPTEVESKLQDALSKKNWGLASHFQTSEGTHLITREHSGSWRLCGRRSTPRARTARRLQRVSPYGALDQNGAERVVDECRERIYTIRTLTEFQFEDRKDKGGGVREARDRHMLNDTSAIRAAWAKARCSDLLASVGARLREDCGASRGGNGRYSGSSSSDFNCCADGTYSSGGIGSSPHGIAARRRRRRSGGRYDT